MAAALLNHHAMGRINVVSAGSTPAEEVNQVASAAMAEWGLDISRETPNTFTDDDVRAADIVVTMGCGDTCPVFQGTRYVDWDLTDPSGRDISVVRSIRNDIDVRVRALLRELIDRDA
jgi:protein-tyrosine-phosphatase